MELATIFLVVTSSILICSYAIITRRSGWRKLGGSAQLPPGPYPLPIIGSIHQLCDKPHRSLASLSKTYGPLMSLKLGTTTIIVVSSHEVAEEFFHKHDLSFSSRSVPYSAHNVNHHKFSMVWLPVGDQWRRLRRICKEHLFSVPQLDASHLLRWKKVQELLDYVHQCCINGEAVNIGEVASTTTLNVLSNFIFSTDLAPYDSPSSQEFKHIVWALMEIGGKPNLADFFPILQPLDPHGLLRKANFYGEKLMAIFDGIISQRLRERSNYKASTHLPSSGNDVLDLLLDLSQTGKSEVSSEDIRHLFFDIFLAGTDTTSSTLEWAMAELICNPEIMAKARSELKEIIIEKDDVVVQEHDISRLPYLQAIVKETLRLHPPVPFLVPHKAIQEVEIQGFSIPKDAQILCNVWAMGRDLRIWSNPQTFMPERFLDVGIDYKGQDFELIPFGAGRRICPGIPLAHRMLHLMLGSLIYKYDWKVEGEMRAEDMDMNEKFGITLCKNVPLMAIPIKIQEP